MKLFESRSAPNPRRVRIFIAEKGIEVPCVEVDIGKAVNREAEFREINPMGEVPVLQLDDGRHLAESVAICRYIEGRYPDPPLMGVDADDGAFVEMWNRRMELSLMDSITGTFRNTHAFFAGRIPQVPEYGEVCRERAHALMRWLDSELADRPFVAGERFTIADITALCAIDFGRAARIRMPDELRALKRWHEVVSARPSAGA